jgi:hypothetical protein
MPTVLSPTPNHEYPTIKKKVKVHWGVNDELEAFQTSEINEGEWSVSRFDGVTSQESRYEFGVRMGGAQCRFEHSVGEEKTPC